jgi:hypothetical protein
MRSGQGMSTRGCRQKITRDATRTSPIRIQDLVTLKSLRAILLRMFLGQQTARVHNMAKFV